MKKYIKILYVSIFLIGVELLLAFDVSLSYKYQATISMEKHNYNKQHTLNELISTYEVMSQKKSVVFYEETVFLDIVEYYQSTKKIESALSAVETGLSQHNYSAQLYFKKAELLSLYSHNPLFLEDALIAAEKAESLSPQDLGIKLLKSQLYGWKGAFPEAFKLIEEIREQLPVSYNKELADTYYCEGLLYDHLQDYESMYEVWREALLLNPEHQDVFSRIRICIEFSDKYEESVELFTHLIDEDPYSHLAWFHLGHVQAFLGEREAAIEAFEYAYIIDNTFEWAYKECATLWLEQKEYAKALECYEEALNYIIPDGDLLYHIGKCYQYQNSIDVAFDLYKKAADLDPYNDEIYFSMGECMSCKEKWSNAIPYFKQAIGLDSRREEYYAALGSVYYKLEQYDRAYRCFDKAAVLAPEQTSIWVQFATFLFNVGYFEEALEVLDDGDMHAVGEELLYCRVACLYKLGQDSEAITVLASALEDDYEKHDILFKYLPELASNSTYSSVINYYRMEG